MTNIKYFIKLLRPHQYIKNFLIFLPLFTSQEFNYYNFKFSLFAFISFCLAASAGYIINDIFDIENDKSHPIKKKRPLAAKKINIIDAKKIAALLIFFSFSISYFINIKFIYLILVYFSLVYLYSFFFKKIFILDLFFLTFFFIIRILSGSISTDINLSYWLIFYSIFLFFSLAAVKRQTEIIVSLKKNFNIKGRNYTINNLSLIRNLIYASSFTSAIIFVFYLIFSEEVKIFYSSPLFLWGILIFKIIWILKVISLSNKGFLDVDPVSFAMNNKLSQILIFLSILFFVAAIII